MRIADAFVDELTLEAATTKRVLERVPEARLGWQPYPTSMSRGQLALHVATLPSLVTQFLSGDALDFDSVQKEPPTVATRRIESINEAYVRLIDVNRIRWQNRSHFLAVAAQTMRRILVEFARQRHRQKRGGDAVRVYPRRCRRGSGEER